ncbi:hypothetical protein KEM54_003791, partial [Ascosphaera aggregata]
MAPAHPANFNMSDPFLSSEPTSKDKHPTSQSSSDNNNNNDYPDYNSTTAPFSSTSSPSAANAGSAGSAASIAAHANTPASYPHNHHYPRQRRKSSLFQPSSSTSTLSPAQSSSSPSNSHRDVHRYSSFDTVSLFNLTNANASPAQIRRALEAHLLETERRLQDASKLGTALVDQQRELSEKLKDLEAKDDDGEIGPDLRKRLAELEKEYDDLGRETARATLGSKTRSSLPPPGGDKDLSATLAVGNASGEETVFGTPTG